MSVFDDIHNTIADHALATGQHTHLDCTPVELARAIEQKLGLKEENYRSQRKRSNVFDTWTRWATPWVEGPPFTDERLRSS